MDTNKHTLKSERIVEIVAWTIVFIALITLSRTYPTQLTQKTELPFAGLILTISLLYYYLNYSLLPAKKRLIKNIADIIFIAIMLFLAIQTQSYISLLLIIPLASSLLTLGAINNLLTAALAIITIAFEILFENIKNIIITLEPLYLFIIISTLTILYCRLIAQKAHAYKSIKTEQQSNLEEIGQKLTDMEKQGQEFTSLAAQQIFTPLATIQSFIQTLGSEKPGKLNPKQKEFVQEASNYIEKMHKLLNELLFITKLEFNNSHFTSKPVDILEIAKNSIKKYESTAKQKNLKIHLEYPHENVPSISGTGEYLQEVFDRLIDNALRYCSDEKDIKISLQIIHKDNHPHLLIEIIDLGRGIPKDEQKYIFKRFFRGSNIAPSDTGGNGLSLFIIKLIIDKHQANINFESEIDKGTTFKLEFPLEKMG